MKKRNLKRLTLKKASISSLEKTQASGGIGSLDSQVSCYNTCDINCHAPQEPPLYPIASLIFWLCPR